MMKIANAQMSDDGRRLLLNFVTEVNAEDIVGLANNSYDDIIDFVEALDEHIGDSVFTKMLKDMVKELDD